MLCQSLINRISLIVACSQNGVIGRNGGIPWHLSTDLRRFQRITWGHTLLMGRRTFESLPRCLPHRRHIVLSHSAEIDLPAVQVARSWQEALQLVQGDDLLFVIGGGELYRLALPHAGQAYVTEVCTRLEGDTYFDQSPLRAWNLRYAEYVPAGPRDEYPHWFRVYERPAVHPQISGHACLHD